MFKSSVILASLAVAAQSKDLGDLRSYTFERYVSDFRHNWEAGSEEYSTRKGIFEQELQRVVAHNEGALSLFFPLMFFFEIFFLSTQPIRAGRPPSTNILH
jgi:hypothetical protein